jgi:hypothetical protein
MNFLERGLAPPAAGARLEFAGTRWFGSSDLSTRSVAAAAGWRGVRAAAGFSQTGEPSFGWSALAFAAGAARGAGGVALRAEARRDLETFADAGPLGGGIGAEVGGGAWAEAATGLRLWASAPQLWRRGAAPPLRRALEIGAALESGSLAMWISRAAPAWTDSPPTRRAGLSIVAGPCTAWIEARDQPLRGAVGLAARTGAFRAAATIESHPVLAETVRLVLGLERGGSR